MTQMCSGLEPLMLGACSHEIVAQQLIPLSARVRCFNRGWCKLVLFDSRHLGMRIGAAIVLVQGVHFGALGVGSF